MSPVRLPGQAEWAGPGRGVAEGPGQAGRAALAVIAKEPVAGLAKTRLAAALGATGAAKAAAAMLADTLAVVATVGATPWLCFTPAGARDRLARLAPGFGLLPQAGGDLGDRLAACLDELRTDADQAAIVGSDTPHVPAALYRRAFAMLGRADIVLGPALDGGYYLVAACGAWPELFVGIPMGTATVLSETVARAARLGLRVGLLPVLRDLDRVGDLEAALARGELDGCPRTRAAVAELLADVPAVPA